MRRTPKGEASLLAKLRRFSLEELERGDQLYAGTGLILNQMEYMAGRNTKVKIVPANVPPISV
jgi:hypothetical protein